MIVLVTDATSVHGRRLAFELSARAHTVLVHGHDPHRTARLAAKLPYAAPYVADLSSPAAVRVLAAQLAATYPNLDLLLHTAGSATLAPLTHALREAGVTATEIRDGGTFT